MAYRPGKQHKNADAMSRIPSRKCGRDDCPECELIKCQNSGQGTVDNAEQGVVCPVLEGLETLQSEDSTNDIPNWLENWTHDELVDMQANDRGIDLLRASLQDSETRPSNVEIAGLTNETKVLWRA